MASTSDAAAAAAAAAAHSDDDENVVLSDPAAAAAARALDASLEAKARVARFSRQNVKSLLHVRSPFGGSVRPPAPIPPFGVSSSRERNGMQRGTSWRAPQAVLCDHKTIELVRAIADKTTTGPGPATSSASVSTADAATANPAAATATTTATGPAGPFDGPWPRPRVHQRGFA